jgi:hypothetical protein
MKEGPMAKDTDKKGSGKKGKKDGGKKAAKKAEGGIKIPKPLRKAGKEALKLASEPVVSEIVAAALLSAAAALRGDKVAAKAGRSGAAAAGAPGEAAGTAGRQASKLGDSMRALALDLARKTLDNWERSPAREGGGGKGGKGKSGGGSGDAGG